MKVGAMTIKKLAMVLHLAGLVVLGIEGHCAFYSCMGFIYIYIQHTHTHIQREQKPRVPKNVEPLSSFVLLRLQLSLSVSISECV